MSVFKKIEKGQKIYNLIKEIDKEIIHIEKLGDIFSQHETEIKLDLTRFFEPEKEMKNGEEFKFYSPLHSLMEQYAGVGLYGSIHKDKPKKEEDKFSSNISNSCALQILGLILRDKQIKRSVLMAQIEVIMGESCD